MADTIVENNEVRKAPAEKKKRNPPQTIPLKHSNFFITINSQKNMLSYPELEQKKLVHDFTNAVREFYNSKLSTHEFLLLEGSKQGEKFKLDRDASREDLMKRIKDTQVKFVIEVGPESHKLHSHGMVAISKRGVDTKLDYNRIRDYFKEKLGYDIHLNVRLFNDAKKSLDAYIEKNPFN